MMRLTYVSHGVFNGIDSYPYELPESMRGEDTDATPDWDDADDINSNEDEIEEE